MSLIVHGWAPGPPGEAPIWVRQVTDSAGVPVGTIRFEGTPPNAWFAWLRRLRLDVFETEDASHLMTLIRAWGMRGSWHVQDAEDFHVGTVHRGRIVSSDGVVLGHVDGSSAGGRVLDSRDKELAAYRKSTNGIVEVTFAKEAMGNPFLRMLLLGSILVLEPIPA